MEKVAPHIATGGKLAVMQALFETTVDFFAREANALKAEPMRDAEHPTLPICWRTNCQVARDPRALLRVCL